MLCVVIGFLTLLFLDTVMQVTQGFRTGQQSNRFEPFLVFVQANIRSV